LDKKHFLKFTNYIFYLNKLRPFDYQDSFIDHMLNFIWFTWIKNPFFKVQIKGKIKFQILYSIINSFNLLLIKIKVNCFHVTKIWTYFSLNRLNTFIKILCTKITQRIPISSQHKILQQILQHIEKWIVFLHPSIS